MTERFYDTKYKETAVRAEFCTANTKYCATMNDATMSAV